MAIQKHFCFTLITFFHAIQIAPLVSGSDCNVAQIYPNPTQTKTSTVVTSGISSIAKCSSDDISCGEIASCSGKCTCDYDGTGCCNSETLTSVSICGTGTTNSVPATPVDIRSNTYVYRTEDKDAEPPQDLASYEVTQNKITIKIRESIASEGLYRITAQNEISVAGDKTILDIFKQLFRILSSNQIREIFQDKTIRTIFRENVNVTDVFRQ